MPDYAWFDLGDGRQTLRRVRNDTPSATSSLPCPMIITDYIEIKSMVDGKIYTSKRALRRSYRENGYIEIGNEEQKMPEKPKPDRKAIQHSVRAALSKVGIST